jgi:hypothetical protein
MRLPLCRCGCDTVIKKTCRSAEIYRSEMTRWVNNCRSPHIEMSAFTPNADIALCVCEYAP